ncbi:MAG: TatD family hydrolase [Spirochaetaceae bacterium]|jgi:TatD DNase family protein|nr:TatD family hydrolase [Spirochaetaceae bacterium]
MASCAHAHPADLVKRLSGAEEERRRFSVASAASAWNRRDFEYHENLAERARRENAAPMALCFAVHPQLPAAEGREESAGEFRGIIGESLALLESLAAEGRLRAIGETGFDLYNAAFRSTEGIQEELFACHLETARRRDLPLVLHIRRAMHRVFAHAGILRKLPAVVFHSYSGTAGEGEALLRRGINAYFSFGAVITTNHREAMRACAVLPLDHLLTETDAPYQPRRGAAFSRWADIPATLRAMAALRAGPEPVNPEALEAAIDENWRRVFG